MKKQFYFTEYKRKIQFVIANKGFHWFPASFLGLFSFFCFSFPVLVIWFTGGPVGFGFVVTILIFGGIGLYTLRLFLWNLVGKEIFQKSDRGIEHYYDYGIFKDNIDKPTKPLVFFYTTDRYSDEIFEFGENDKFETNKEYFLGYKISNQLNTSDYAVSGEDIEDFRTLTVMFQS